jgi:hypothetical protein
MKFERRTLGESQGTILLHNIAGADGRRKLKKGILLSRDHIALLTELGRVEVDVAVLETEDVHEDAAALAMAEAMRTDTLYLSRPAGGRVNLRSSVDGLVEVDATRLLVVNMLTGFALATRRQHTVVGPGQDTDNVGTMKIVPYAIPRRDLERAVELASARPGIVEIRPFQPGRQVAMLIIAEAPAREKTRNEYLPPTETRLARLGAKIVATEAVPQDEEDIAEAAARLASVSDLLIIAGQTSIIHEEDVTLRALRRAGAEMTLSGAPIEPGNLMALAYLPGTPVLCAPACAKGLKRNGVDVVLPRLLLGDRLERQDIAALGLGGFLTRAERAGDTR